MVKAIRDAGGVSEPFPPPVPPDRKGMRILQVWSQAPIKALATRPGRVFIAAAALVAVILLWGCTVPQATPPGISSINPGKDCRNRRTGANTDSDPGAHCSTHCRTHGQAGFNTDCGANSDASADASGHSHAGRPTGADPGAPGAERMGLRAGAAEIAAAAAHPGSASHARRT